jgi:acyl carrier protein
MIKEKIVAYLRNINPVFLEEVEEIGVLKITEIIDSLGMLEFIVFLEESFSIDIQDANITSENFNSIDSLTTFIQDLLTSNNNKD